MNIAAGFVMFNPDRERFLKCLNIVLSQFDKLIVFDKVGDNERIFDKYEKVVYITEHANKGIAYGLNKIMEQAETMGYEWVVTLDQDIIIPNDMASRYATYTHLDNVAIISPQVIDRRRQYLELNESTEAIIDVEFCITSASCTNI